MVRSLSYDVDSLAEAALDFLVEMDFTDNVNILIDFERQPLYFTEPETVVCCFDPARFAEAFEEIERLLDRGLYVAGFLSYEAGYCFEERLYEKKKYDFPLVLMAAYRKPLPQRIVLNGRREAAVGGFRLNISKADYAAAIGRIRDYIAAGDVYQITYCIKLKFAFQGEPLSLYRTLLDNQPVPYPAYLETDRFRILSLSPERFIKKQAERVITEPMKGTWPRGRNMFRDALARFSLSRDAKNRAENVMIADLLRNDLGRVGSRVRAPRLFTVTGYRTLYQMTSTVTAEVPRALPLYDMFRALFPSGSVTGAPKIRAMEIIRGLEQEERKIYTGAIGYITPERDLYFNIPIRTLLIDGASGEMGIGGGIVWDSTVQGEWDEGILKARFLTDLFSEPKAAGRWHGERGART